MAANILARHRAVLVLAVLLCLAACGGGGDSQVDEAKDSQPVHCADNPKACT